MKVTIDINRPINKVVELFMDKGNFKEWKKDFVRHEPVSGIPGQVGAVTRLIGKRGAMVETVLSNNLPGEIVEQYEHKRGDRTMMVHKAVNRFVPLTGTSTRFEVETTVTEVNGLLLKLIMKLMAGAGKKYAQGQLDNFKRFAENNAIG